MNYERWLSINIGSLKGRVFIVTGATGTIGRAVVEHLLRLDAAVVMAVRNLSKAETLKSELLRDYPYAFIDVKQLDLCKFQSLDVFCADVVSEYSRIDGLINVAGVYGLPAKKTEDGFDVHYQVNYLAPLQLSDRLRPLLDGGRAVFTSSISQNFAKVNEYDAESEKVKSRIKVYARSKRLLNDGVKKMRSYYPYMRLNIAHPGVCSSGLFEKAGRSRFIAKVIKSVMRVLFSPPEVCALSIVYAATHNIEEGRWVHPRALGVWGKPAVTKIKD